MEGFFRGAILFAFGAHLLVILPMWINPEAGSFAWIEQKSHLYLLVLQMGDHGYQFPPWCGKISVNSLKPHTDAHKPSIWRVSALNTYHYTYYAYIIEPDATDD